jgi:hypothetical protein
VAIGRIAVTVNRPISKNAEVGFFFSLNSDT